ncbi:cupin domain-containing protein [Rhodococcoides kyotonense]|uniref:ChrR Cupin-like domain-containing protein n=1 Tax=Rhodococcoides kyotonense TaxID=398843 RepID=A0A239NF17_9NOCA|nr:cupin domain-containing protein [Rhodococcus kyotonensis]SNT53102.1 ChrR Cupin-like domain-containing protein [Rhodococcus kyotonensis]
MAKPELEFHSPTAEWTRANEVSTTPGISDQVLSHDPVTGDKTALQRYDAGAETPPGVITHEFWEEVLLLDGDLYDVGLDRTFTAGMYACRPPGMPHGPYRSVGGCSMLVVTRYPA